MNLSQETGILVRQRHELGEWFGFETRNKYEILGKDGRQIGFAAEQQKGFLGFIMRQWLGHWRSFELHIFNEQKQLAFIASNPFRWLFQRLEVRDAQGKFLGALQQRFAILEKRFDVEDAYGKVIMEVASPFWKLWTFPFISNGREVATVEKKWSGAFFEMLTDKDNFMVTFKNPNRDEERRSLLLAAALFIDLQYFEAKAR